MSTGREIRLTEEDDGGWSAIDEAVALHRGDTGEPVPEDDLRELGIDPETVPDDPQEPDAPWFEE
jgi:hypothetical protein